MEKISVTDIFLESLRLSVTRRTLWFLGLVIALPGALVSVLLKHSPFRTTTEILSFITTLPLGVLLLFGIGYCLLTLVGKSALILTLEAKKRREHSGDTTLLPSYFSAFTKAFRIDFVLVIFFTIVVVVLALPIIVSSVTQGEPSDLLLTLAELTLLPIVLIGYGVREFTYFYFLLSPLTLKSSFEAGSNLIFRNKKRCLQFGVVFLVTGILFTFLLNLVMLSIVTLSRIAPGSTISDWGPVFLAALLSLAWYEVLKQVFWFEFFRTLARPKNTLPQENIPQLLKEEVEVPSV